MSAMKITFLLAIAGHLLCGACDCLLTYMPGGRFHFEDMKDNDRLSAVFKGMSLRNSLLSMLLGCLAMFLFAFGYLSLAHWMSAFSEPCAVLIALIETIRVLYRRVGAENFEEALDELREALSTIVRLLFDYLDVDQLAEFLERMGR